MTQTFLVSRLEYHESGFELVGSHLATPEDIRQWFTTLVSGFGIIENDNWGVQAEFPTPPDENQLRELNAEKARAFSLRFSSKE